MPNKKTTRETHELDATNVSMGRLASQVATLLIGKNKVNYQPNQDLGDKVVIENVKKLKLTGNKLDKKVYQRHTGYPGGVKTRSMKELYENHPAKLFRDCVWSMLPKNRLRKNRIKRLTIK